MEIQNENKDNLQKKRKINWEIFLIGWAGTLLIITAYSLNSLSYIASTNLAYPILNLFGAIFLGIRVYVDKNWANLFLEFFWAIIAILSILKYFNIYS